MTPKVREAVELAGVDVGLASALLPPPDICVQVFHVQGDKPGLREDFLYAHRQVLAKAPRLRALLLQQANPLGALGLVSLDLSMVEEGLATFRALLHYLYTGQLSRVEVSQQSLVHLVEHLDLSVSCAPDYLKLADMNKQPTLPTPASTAGDMNMFNTVPSVTAPQLQLYAAYLSLLQSQQNGQLLQALLQQASSNLQHLLPAAAPPAPSIFPLLEPGVLPKEPIPTRISESEQSEAPSVASTCSTGSASAPGAPSPSDQLNDVLVPSNEKEGWCRNKKYIQTVQKGYRCTVCNKVYGRYNSVSYHVTIYHRNPPIKCEEQGCQFTTREARYIHFHKYYRHGVPLPESIDLASRKCPFFSCKHVSKSPAMLDKHINRHVADCTKDGQRYECPKCEYRTEHQRDMFQHLRAHQLGPETESRRPAPGPISGPSHVCEQCPFKARTLNGLEQHRCCKHGRGLFPEPQAAQLGLGPLPTFNLLKALSADP